MSGPFDDAQLIPESAGPSRIDRALSSLGFLSGGRFAVFVIALQLWGVALMILMLFVPAEETALETFAAEFRKWCFGADGSGNYNYAYVAAYTMSPLVIAAGTWIVWAGPLRALRKAGFRGFVFPSTLALATVAFTAAILAIPSSSTATPTFDLRAMRTSFFAPSFRLIDQSGQRFEMGGSDPQVTLVTGVYASCGFACPTILQQVRGALERLDESERAQVRVAAITLDPERDSPARLTELANAQHVSAPAFRFLTGEPKEVNAVLDAFSIARERNPSTGVIDHANLFILVDRQGRVAYRFSVGTEERAWVSDALRILVREPYTGPSPRS